MAEVVARVARAPSGATVTVTTIEGGATVRFEARGFGPVDAAWLRSPDGVHHAVVGEGALYVQPALPDRPAPVTLVLVSAGAAIEVDLR
jgi:hypothetical protein